MCFLRWLAKEDPEDDKREKVEEIDIPGLGADHEYSDDCHAKRNEEFSCEEGCISPGKFRFKQSRVRPCIVPLPCQENRQDEIVELERDIGRRDRFALCGKALGEGHENDNHQGEEMEVEELVIEGLHPVEHLEIKKPEHPENNERTDKIGD